MWRASVLLLMVCSCVKRVDSTTQAARSVRLLAATDERETGQWLEKRDDLQAESDFERTPRVVATGETGLLSAEGVEWTLAGDEAGTREVSVDNCILLEVLRPDGAVSARAVVGFIDGLSLGAERIDSLGRNAFTFEPREVSLARILPEHGQFRLRATVLDVGRVGRVSDVFVLVSPRGGSSSDDLRQ